MLEIMGNIRKYIKFTIIENDLFNKLIFEKMNWKDNKGKNSFAKKFLLVKSLKIFE